MPERVSGQHTAVRRRRQVGDAANVRRQQAWVLARKSKVQTGSNAIKFYTIIDTGAKVEAAHFDIFSAKCIENRARTVAAIVVSKKNASFEKLDQTDTAGRADGERYDKAHWVATALSSLVARYDAATMKLPPTACKETSMAHQLRIYHGPGEDSIAVKAPVKSNCHQITVSVGEVLPLLADAVASQRTWLKDFKNDEITISADLYEVLLAYQYFRRPSA